MRWAETLEPLRLTRIQANCLHQNASMRAAAALIVLFSLLSGSLASALCKNCCNPSVQPQLMLCHEKAPAHLSPPVHQMHQIRLLTQESESAIDIQACDYQLCDTRSSCDGVARLSSTPVREFVSCGPSPELRVTSPSAAIATYSSRPITRAYRLSGAGRVVTSSSASACTCLRI
jgi:hypothetical protein